MKTRITFFFTTLLVLLLGSCKKDTSFEGEAYSLKLHFRPSANGQPLAFNKEYINPIGEDYTVQRFKFYISHVALLQDQIQPIAEDRDGIFLIDAADEASKTITVSLNGQVFNKLSFQLGIDSIYNVSGAQTGALDPLNGMFWTWNSGYIMAKLEGNSSLSNGPGQAITYHIGGFQGDQKTQRQIMLSLPQQQQWALEKNSVTEMVIDVDIDQWFASTHTLPIASYAETMSPGPLAVQYADNMTNMFRMESILRRQ